MKRGSLFVRAGVAASAAAAMLALVWRPRELLPDAAGQVRAMGAAPMAAAPPAPPLIVSALVPGRTVVAGPALRLLRVGTSPHGGQDIAVMRVHGGPPTRYTVGDSVSVGVRLLRIHATHVELERESGLERVFLNADEGSDELPPPLKPLRGPRHGAGADAATDVARARDLALVTEAGDQAPRSSTAVERAIERARRP